MWRWLRSRVTFMCLIAFCAAGCVNLPRPQPWRFLGNGLTHADLVEIPALKKKVAERR
jgi:hypothetical protein